MSTLSSRRTNVSSGLLNKSQETPVNASGMKTAPSPRYCDAKTMYIPTVIERRPHRGEIQKIAAQVDETPLPPLNLTAAGKSCPSTAPSPAYAQAVSP